MAKTPEVAGTHIVSDLAWQRMVTAVEKVRDRLRRATKALADAGIPYAAAGFPRQR